MNLISMNAQIHSFTLLILLINAILHVIFAGAVIKDAGFFIKKHYKTHLVSPMTWAFATLVGGVVVVAIYWFMHHGFGSDLSKLNRN